jgi:hypothetical protein
MPSFEALADSIGPEPGPGRILISGDGAAGDQRPPPVRHRRLRGDFGLSRLNDFLALWSLAHMSFL